MKITSGFVALLLATFVGTAVFATTTTETYSNNFGSRSYSIYVPEKLPSKIGLLVILHGCFMTGDQMATGTELNKFADERGFIIIYPEQTYNDNQWKCWNWFKPENQRRDDGEASIIVGMTQEAVKKYKVDAARVVVSGISAGSAMAANLLGCYSDVYAGGFLESGLEFAAAQTEDDAHKAASDGPTRDLDASARQALDCSPARQKPMTVVVVHGSSDPFVKPINADRTAELFEKLAVLTNGSGTITHNQSKITQDGYKFSADVTDSLIGDQEVVKKVMVTGMGHGWSGGNPAAPYMEPRGVKASQILVDTFFPQ